MDAKFCPYCEKAIPSHGGMIVEDERKEDKSNKVVLIVLIVVALVVIVPIAIAATVYVYVSGMIGSSGIPDSGFTSTPLVSLTADATNSSKCIITVSSVSESDIYWSFVTAMLYDVSTGSEIDLGGSYSTWRPSGYISAGDQIILDDAYIEPDFVDDDQYRLILTYGLTDGTMGTITWTQ